MSSPPEHYDASSVPPDNTKKRRRRLITLVLGLAALALVCVCLSSLIALGLDDLNQLPMLVSGVEVDGYTAPHALSDEQERLIGLSGYPDSFTILFYDDNFGGTSTRLETWMYSGEGMRYTFVNGSEDSSESFAPLTGEIMPAPYTPEQFSAYMSLEDILSTTKLDEFLLLPLEEELVPGGESYFADRIAFGLKDGELMYVEAIGFAGEDSGVAETADEPDGLAEPAPTAEPASTEWIGAPVVFVSGRTDPDWPGCFDTEEGCNTQLLLIYPEDPNFEGFLMLTADYDFEYVHTPAISPDGTRIAFGGYRDGATNIYVIDIDGSNLTQVTSDAAGVTNFRPVWDPAGIALAYISNREGEQHWNIFLQGLMSDEALAEQGMVINAPSLNSTRWNDGDYNLRFVDWYISSEQSFFVWTSDLVDPSPGACFPDCEWGLYQYRFEEEELWHLDPGGGMKQIGGPAISPDGRYIAFHGWDGDAYQIFIYDLDTHDVHQFSDMPGEHYFTHPRWSPGGRGLVFTVQMNPDSNHTGIAFSPVDEFDLIWITDADANDFYPDW